MDLIEHIVIVFLRVLFLFDLDLRAGTEWSLRQQKFIDWGLQRRRNFRKGELFAALHTEV